MPHDSVMPHVYRITLDAIEPGEEELTSVSFFASTSHDILAAARELSEQLHCSASHATRLALGYGLIDEAPKAGK